MLAIRLALFCALVSLTTVARSDTLVGAWLLDDQPVVMAITEKEGVFHGVVTENADNGEAVGRTLLRNVTAAGEGWEGEIFVARLKEFRQANLTLQGADTLAVTVKVGFIKRTVTWSRRAQE